MDGWNDKGSGVGAWASVDQGGHHEPAALLISLGLTESEITS